ncbi:MAG TPA: PAS domain S-box protein [Phycisphaerae bacterium]|nr:PAS domain S-box protein [Phycisphaerae bacterium]
MHRLLQRQLKKYFDKTDQFPDELQQFVNAVDDAYTHADEDRALNERSMDLSSNELQARNAELAEAKVEKKYRAIFENVTEGIFQSTPQGRYILANPALAKIYGYDSPEELKNSITDIAAQIYDKPSSRGQVLSETQRHGSICNWESQVRRKDGTLIWISETSHAVCDSNGNILYFEGTVRDITARKLAEMERQELKSRLISISHQAGMAEVATGVLHNVGNVLNSVNVSASVAMDKIKALKVSAVSRIAQMFHDHREDLPAFLTQDQKGSQICDYLGQLGELLVKEQDDILQELSSLCENIKHVKQIITMQQNYARVCGVSEEVLLPELLDDALRINGESLERHRIKIVREFEELPRILMEKHRILQMLVNLISNAKQAMRCTDTDRILTIRAGLSPSDSSRFFISVCDTGVGIEQENLTRIFSHGFTTKADGHGFGLHTSALAAKAMGGSITAHSEGSGKGATFIIELPLNSAKQADSARRVA